MDFFSLFQTMFFIGILYNPMLATENVCVNKSFFDKAVEDSLVFDSLACGLHSKIDPTQTRKDLKIPASVVIASKSPRFISIFVGANSKALKYNCLMLFSKDKGSLAIYCPPQSGEAAIRIFLDQKSSANGIIYFASPRKEKLI